MFKSGEFVQVVRPTAEHKAMGLNANTVGRVIDVSVSGAEIDTASGTYKVALSEIESLEPQARIASALESINDNLVDLLQVLLRKK
jgi:hypothetical protein